MMITKTTTQKLVLAALVLTASLAQAGPRLTMYEDAFNFGFMPRGAAVSHDFWLHSTGDDPLLVLQVVPGCSCTQMPLEKKTIPVGDSSRLEIVFHTRTFTGGVTKRPTVTTNESPDPKVMQIIGNVVATPDSTYPIQIQPWLVTITGGPNVPAPQQTFTILNRTKDLLKITVISSPDDFVTVDFPDGLAGRQGGKGVVRINKNRLKNSFEKSVTFELNDAAKSRFTIPIQYLYKVAGAGKIEEPVVTPEKPASLEAEKKSKEGHK